MIKFNLKRALSGDPVITRDGRKVTHITVLEQVKDYPVVGVVEGAESIARWTENGYFLREGSNHVANLFMDYVEKKSIWINIYDNESRMWCSYGYNSQEEANEANERVIKITDSVYIKTIEITNEL